MKKTIADNLYFMNCCSLSTDDLTSIKDGVIENFDQAGIGFEQVDILDLGNFPELINLDIMMLFTDFLFWSEPFEGKYGVGHDDTKEYQYFKKKLDFPYYITQTMTHIGYVEPAKIDLGYTGYKGEKYSLVSKIEVTSHEIGHGLGACHTQETIKWFLRSRFKHYWPDRKTIMGTTNECISLFGFGKINNKRKFDSGSAHQMKEFIGQLKNRLPSDIDICNRRQQIWNGIYTIVVDDVESSYFSSETLHHKQQNI